MMDASYLRMMLSYIHEGCVRTSAGPSLRLARQVGRSVRITLTIAWHALVHADCLVVF